MAICFVTGKTRTGKTDFVYDRIIQESLEHSSNAAITTRTKILLIVPEQSTLDVQHKIIEKHPNHCITDIEILSFGRLAHRMIDDLGIAGRTVISDVGKNMMISKIVQNNEEAYPFIGKNIHKKGYVNELRGLISEFSRYTVTDQDFAEILDQIQDPLLKRKLDDCRCLYKKFNEAVAQNHFTGDSIMELLVSAIPESDFIKNSVIYMDGFYGYTPIQYMLIERLMASVKDLTMTITIDNETLKFEHLNENHLYYESHETYKRLMSLVRDQGDLMVDMVKLDQELPNATMNHLRDYLYQYPYVALEEVPKGLLLSKVSSVTKEATYVRDTILKLVMDKGYRYRDIAILAGDLGRYNQALTGILSQGEIPFYVDQKKLVLTNDVAVFVLNCVKMMQSDLSYRYMFAYLKSGYVECDQQVLDYMENYVIRYGIRGMNRWQQTWTFRVPDVHTEPDSEMALAVLEQINELRRTVIEPLQLYRDKKPKTIQNHVKCLFEFIEAVDLEAMVEAKAQKYQLEGKLNLYREYNQIYRVIIDMLDQLFEIASKESIDFEGFALLLEAGFEQLEVGNVPARLDEVLIGDLTRTRLSKKKAVFIIGINEGAVPMLKEGTSLLTDQERDVMGAKGFELAPSAKKSLFRDQFYIYLKMFSATEMVYLSYAMMDDEGTVSRAAHLIHVIKKLYPLIKEVEIDKLYEERIVINRPEALYGNVIRALQNNEDAKVRQLCAWFKNEKSYESRIDKALLGRSHHEKIDHLSEAIVDQLYGQTILNSVSRLEQFSRCPFAHFAKYALKASEREAYEITMPELGLVFHRVIELFSKRVIESDLTWMAMTGTIRSGWVEELVDQTVAEELHSVFFDSERNRYRIERLKTILNQTLKAIGYQINQGEFQPVSAEWSFKGDNKKIEALNVSLDRDKAMCLLGTIDRVDMMEDSDLKYITIVDYKSSNQDFDLGDIYYGLQLQLIVYLNAAVEITASSSKVPVKPAGVFYFKIDDPFIDGYDTMTDEALEKDLQKEFRLRGVVLDDPTVISKLDQSFSKESIVIPVKKNANGQLSKSSKTLTEEEMETIRFYISKKTQALGNDIVGGKINPKPFKKRDQTACDYCEYNGVCGFDHKLPGHNYKVLEKENDMSYIDLMKE